MPRCTYESEVYGSVFVCVCVCVCVECYIYSFNDQRSEKEFFYRSRLLGLQFFWLEICKIMLRSRIIARFAYLGNAYIQNSV